MFIELCSSSLFLFLFQACFTAIKVLDLWRSIDTSKDRLLSEEELRAISPRKL
jgi:hypothetical protein